MNDMEVFCLSCAASRIFLLYARTGEGVVTEKGTGVYRGGGGGIFQDIQPYLNKH